MTYAHLFDHDNIYINKLEAIIDRFMEICGIEESQKEKVRNHIINLISLDMLIKLVKKLPADQQGVLKSLKESPNIEEVNKLKSKFKENEIIEAFYLSAKYILEDKLSLVKSKLQTDKVFELERLVELIGKY